MGITSKYQHVMGTCLGHLRLASHSQRAALFFFMQHKSQNGVGVYLTLVLRCLACDDESSKSIVAVVGTVRIQSDRAAARVDHRPVLVVRVRLACVGWVGVRAAVSGQRFVGGGRCGVGGGGQRVVSGGSQRFVGVLGLAVGTLWSNDLRFQL